MSEHLRSGLAADLVAYRGRNPAEAPVSERILAFLEAHPDAFSRSCREGHITGSAFIFDPGYTHTLFVHHAKLGKWLQPGGHCEAGETALEAARREALEETGLAVGDPFEALPWDLDIHEIPARGSDPVHLHLDIRYLFVVPVARPVASAESHAVDWLELAEALARNGEESIRRPLAKILKIN